MYLFYVHSRLYFRFADFMETSAHVSTEAVEEHEKELDEYETEYNSESENDLSNDSNALHMSDTE